MVCIFWFLEALMEALVADGWHLCVCICDSMCVYMQPVAGWSLGGWAGPVINARRPQRRGRRAGERTCPICWSVFYTLFTIWTTFEILLVGICWILLEWVHIENVQFEQSTFSVIERKTERSTGPLFVMSERSSYSLLGQEASIFQIKLWLKYFRQYQRPLFLIFYTSYFYRSKKSYSSSF